MSFLSDDVTVLKSKREEIIDGGMALFLENGYGNVTLENIASDMGISMETLERYFLTKKDLLDYAIRGDAMRSSLVSMSFFFDGEKSFEERVDAIAENLFTKGRNRKYYEFYNMPGNESLHFQLGIERAKYMSPALKFELKKLKERGEISSYDIEEEAEFILFGWVGLWISAINAPREATKEKAYDFMKYVYDLLELDMES